MTSNSNQDQVTIDMLPNEILMEYLFPLLSSSDLWHLSQLSNLLRHKVRMYFDEFNTVLNLGVSDEDYQTNRWQNLFLNDIKSMFRRQEHKSGDNDSSAEYEKLEFVTENSTSLLKIHLQWDSVLDFHDKILKQALLRNKVWLSLKHAISLNVHFDYFNILDVLSFWMYYQGLREVHLESTLRGRFSPDIFHILAHELPLLETLTISTYAIKMARKSPIEECRKLYQSLRALHTKFGVNLKLYSVNSPLVVSSTYGLH